MKIRNWLWLAPALAGGIPAVLAATSLFQGEYPQALNRGLSAIALFTIAIAASALFTGGLKRWVDGLAESITMMFNFRAGGLRHRMWQLPVGLALVAAIFSTFKLHFNTGSITHVYLMVGGYSFVLLYTGMMLASHKWAKPGFATIGLMLLGVGFYLWSYKSPQVEAYNAGIAAMDQGDLPTAMKAFDASIAASKVEAGRTQLERLIFPEPNRDLEARAHFHKGNILVKARKPQDAVKAYILSLTSNPGNSFDGLTIEGAAARYNDALHTQANLEKLFSSGQGGGKATGNGRGKPGQQPSPGRDKQPSPGAGRQPRDSL